MVPLALCVNLRSPWIKLGHHTTTCKKRITCLPPSQCFVRCHIEFFRRALRTHPADILVPSWSIGKPAACVVTAVNPLNPSLILGASSTVGYLAAEKEVVKMTKNGPKYMYRTWVGVHSPGCRDIYMVIGERRHRKLSTVTAGGLQWAQPQVKPG